MKTKITLFAFVLTFVSSIGFAQKTVKAEDIIKDIKAGKELKVKSLVVS